MNHDHFEKILESAVEICYQGPPEFPTWLLESGLERYKLLETHPKPIR
jgi:hypothetical protein